MEQLTLTPLYTRTSSNYWFRNFTSLNSMLLGFAQSMFLRLFYSTAKHAERKNVDYNGYYLFLVGSVSGLIVYSW